MMFEFLNTWQFNLIAYLITVVIFFQSYKKAVIKAHDDGAATILLQIIAGVSIMALIPFLPITFPKDPMIYILLIAASVFYAITDRLQTTARKHLEVSIFSILNQILTIFLIAYGFILFQEEITEGKLVGAGIIILGNIFLLYENGKITINKYTILSVLASFFMATAVAIDVKISTQFNLPMYIMITLLIPAIFIALAQRISPKAILREYDKISFRHFLLAGAAWSFSIFFSLRSFQFGDVSLIVPLQATAVLFNVIIASILFKEKTPIDKKIVAAAAVIVGVTITTLTQ